MTFPVNNLIPASVTEKSIPFTTFALVGFSPSLFPLLLVRILSLLATDPGEVEGRLTVVNAAVLVISSLLRMVGVVVVVEVLVSLPIIKLVLSFMEFADK